MLTPKYATTKSPSRAGHEVVSRKWYKSLSGRGGRPTRTTLAVPVRLSTGGVAGLVMRLGREYTRAVAPRRALARVRSQTCYAATDVHSGPVAADARGVPARRALRA